MMIQPAPLEQLLNDKYNGQTHKYFSEPFKRMQYKAIMQAGESIGAQKGFEWKIKKLWAQLQSESSNLDKVYDFNRWMLDGGKVVPPVIEKATQAYQSQGDNVAVTTNVEYKILRPAELISAAPNWRQYFIAPQKLSSMQVNYALLPKNAKETVAWQEGVQKGWVFGIKQANDEYQQSLRRLQRDYMGIMLFWSLSRQHMVSAPIMANGDIGIVVEHNKLSIGQKVFRLTYPSQFNGTSKWNNVPGAPTFNNIYNTDAGSVAEPKYSRSRSIPN